MDFEVIVQNISTLNDIKRVANAYVFDYRSLNKEELVGALIKVRNSHLTCPLS